jgi:hypothetical protein
MKHRNFRRDRAGLLILTLVLTPALSRGGEFEQLLKPLFVEKCVKCHGGDETNADVNLRQFNSADQLRQRSDLIEKTIEVLDTSAMPPEGELALADDIRAAAVSALKVLLRESAQAAPRRATPLQRLNRFQYNNTVRDLFQLNRDLFALPERLMTRDDNYLRIPTDPSQPGQMPETVQVASPALHPPPGLQGTVPFPKDLRAEHGFDNQASQLTLSPALLDAYLGLSVSIVESPEFNEQSVGIWNEFFKEPAAGADPTAEARTRLGRFLRRAFRGPVDDETLERYLSYAAAKLGQGLSFTDSMKKVASAALSSPLFLYRAPAANDVGRQFELASRLSYFLWASCPDEELLELAERGELSRPDVLDRTVSRMLSDPKVERFLDSFPAQWMQLENVLAATPDPQINKYFSFDPATPAGLQFVLEPLLLFDALFVEDRPIVELIAPEFSYQSEFLRTWYTTDLKPPPVDTAKIQADNQRLDQRREELQSMIRSIQAQLDELLRPIRMRLLAARRTPAETAVDLRPFAVWEFDGDLKELVRGLDLTAHGSIEFRNGSVALNKSYLQSPPLPVDLRAKSLEVWCRLNNLDQPGGGLMGIQGPGDFFDTIVIGERKNRHWISGSNMFSRTEDFPGSTEETITDDVLHLVMVYAEDGTTRLFRNGKPYGEPYRKGQAVFPREASSVLFGLRHLPPGGNRYLAVSIDRACLYDRALTADEVAASARGNGTYIAETELAAALTPDQGMERERLTSILGKAVSDLKAVPPNVDPQAAQQQAESSYENELRRQLRSHTFRRVPADDPRYGGIVTNAAVLSMTSGPKRTHPVARGVWIIEVLFNDPPPPPPNNVPPLDEGTANKDLTIREQFAAHRENPSCAGCHVKLDPLGFALENFDITGRWRDRYDNGRAVDSSGTLLRKYPFDGVVSFKKGLVQEDRRFARAFTEHLLRFAVGSELGPADSLAVDQVLARTQQDKFPLRKLIRAVIFSDSFLRSN